MGTAENVIMTKLRALYARCLTPDQFRQMLACRTPAEVAAYVRGHAVIGQYMPRSIPSPPHREWLENRLREAQLLHFEELAHFAYTIRSDSYRYYVIEREISRLAHSLALVADRANSELLPCSPFFTRLSTVNWRQIEQADSLKQWLDALQGTPYEALCRPYIDTVGGNVDRMGLGHRVSSYKMQLLTDGAKRAYKGAERKAVVSHLQVQIDLQNITTCYRLSRLRHRGALPPGDIPLIMGGTLNSDLLQQAAQTADRNRWRALLASTNYARIADVGTNEPIELPVDRFTLKQCRHELRFTTFPPVAMLAYVSLQRLELKNMILAVEGVRYQATDTALSLSTGTTDRR